MLAAGDYAAGFMLQMTMRLTCSDNYKNVSCAVAVGASLHRCLGQLLQYQSVRLWIRRVQYMLSVLWGLVWFSGTVVLFPCLIGRNSARVVAVLLAGKLGIVN